MCNHDWHPVSGWCARYRCSQCRALGFKFRVVMGYGDPVIEPYHCQARPAGGRCNNLAVTRRKREMRCLEHGSSHRTLVARKQPAGSRGVPAAAFATTDDGDATPAARRADEFDGDRR
jgi:hypothetical protein